MKNSHLFIAALAIVVILGGAVAYFGSPRQLETSVTTPAQTQQSTTPENSSQQTSTSPASLPTSGHELVKICTSEMATVFHIHQHLVVLIQGKPVNIPAGIGIDEGKQCLSPVHTHDVGGIIHVESPVQATFTLADFFYNWKIPFDKTRFGDYKVDQDHGLKFYVNGQESTDFQNLVLEDDQEINIVYYNLKDGPGQLPPAFKWQQ